MYRSVVLAKRPKGTIVPGETFAFQTKRVPTKADLKDGEVILQTLYLSLDPAMRGWLNGMLGRLSVMWRSLALTDVSSWGRLQTQGHTYRPSRLAKRCVELRWARLWSRKQRNSQ